jgi:hypothetical protein
MKKGNLFLDYDDLLVDSKPVLIKYLNQRYELNLTLSNYSDNDSLEKVIQEHRKDLEITFNQAYLDIGHNFHASYEWNMLIKPLEDMPKVLPELAKKYILHIPTARQKTGYNVLNQMINIHVPGSITSLHCVWEYIKGKGYCDIPKRDFILSIPGEKVAFIDDSMKEVRRTKDIIPSYNFDRHGVYTVPEEGILKLSSWNDIGEKFL